MDLIHLKSPGMKQNKCKECGQSLPDREKKLYQGDFTTFMDNTIKKVFRRYDEKYRINIKKHAKGKTKKS